MPSIGQFRYAGREYKTRKELLVGKVRGNGADGEGGP